MRVLIIPVLLAAFTVRPTLPAAAADCPFPMVKVCEPAPKTRPPVCRCENPPGNPPHGTPDGPTVKKKNVPTVKSNQSPGIND